MPIHHLLNPMSDEEELRFHRALELGKRAKYSGCLPETREVSPPLPPAELGIQALLLLGEPATTTNTSLKGSPGPTSSPSPRPSWLDSSECEKTEDDGVVDSDEDRDITFDDTEDDRLSPSPAYEIGHAERCSQKMELAPPQCKELHRQKIDRIAQKIRRLIRDLDLPPELKEGKQIEREVFTTLSSLSPMKVMKKTVNQTTATVGFYVLKKLSVSISLKDVIQALKKGERTKSLSRSTKPNYSRNHADVLGISKLVSSLESKPSLQEEPHSKTCLDATKKLSNQLECPPNLEKLACEYSALSEQSTLASRHCGSVAAGSILLAAKSLGYKLTLARVSTVSGVSGCTIRKAIRAMEPLVGGIPESSSS